MRVPVDENIPRITVEALDAAGHDVRDIRGTRSEGLPDPGLWSIACLERRLLITTDKGFTEYRNSTHHGILVIRLRQPNRVKIHASVLRAMEHFKDDRQGRLVVMRDRTMSTSKMSFPR